MYAFKSNTASSTKTLGEREQTEVHSSPALSLSDKENKQSLASSGLPPMSQTLHDPLMCLSVTVMYTQPQEFKELSVPHYQDSAKQTGLQTCCSCLASSFTELGTDEA